MGMFLPYLHRHAIKEKTRWAGIASCPGADKTQRNTLPWLKQPIIACIGNGHQFARLVHIAIPPLRDLLIVREGKLERPPGNRL